MMTANGKQNAPCSRTRRPRGASALALLLALTAGAVRDGAAAPLRQVTIGVPAWAGSLNYVAGSTPAALMTRSLVFDSVISTERTAAGSAPRMTLRLADQVTPGAQAGEWRLRLRSTALFASGEAVTPSDVIDSLEHCPQAAGVIRRLGSDTPQAAGAEDRSYVRLAVDPSKAAPELLYEVLAQCPVWPRTTRENFGNEWGVGTALVGSGPYRITAFLPGKSLQLSTGAPNDARETLEIRGFESDGQGLMALRAGNVAALLLRGLDTPAEVTSDETLRTLHCPLGTVVLRKSEPLPCAPLFDARFRAPVLDRQTIPSQSSMEQQ